MDWITGIQRALDYVESNLTDEVDYEAAAKLALSSVFHFQRMFGMICGYTLGDYIRKRRLSLAADELVRTNAKVIDVALKYGYDSPESFTRAFTRFHGVTPSEAKKGADVKSFSRLSVKLILSGGNTMDYRIEKKEAFKLVCKRKQIDKPQHDIATEGIASFWNECGKDGTIEALCKCGRFDNFKGLLGVCFSSEMDGSAFPYGIGVEHNGAPVTMDGIEIVNVPAQTYAVFTSTGKLPDAVQDVYHRIYVEFFPQSNYEYGSGVELEVYPTTNTQDDDFRCEVWIAVNEKK